VLFVSALIVATVVSTYFAIQANRRATEAEAQKERAQRNLRGSLDSLALLAEVDASHLAHEPHQEQTRLEITKRALACFEQFLRDNAEENELQLELGIAHRRAGSLHFLLGNHAEADRSFQQSIQILDGLAKERPHEAAPRQELGSALFHRARMLDHFGRHEAAENDARLAADIQRKLRAEFSDDITHAHALAHSLNIVGVALRNAGRANDAEPIFRQALEVCPPAAGDVNGTKIAVLCLGNLAGIQQKSGRIKEAEQSYRDAAAAAQSVLKVQLHDREFQATVARLHFNFGSLQSDLSRFAEAEAQLSAAVKLSRRLAEDFPSIPRYRFDAALHENGLLEVWWQMGKRAPAAEMVESTLVLTQRLADDSPGVPFYHALHAAVLNTASSLFRDEENGAKSRQLLEQSVRSIAKAVRSNPKIPKIPRR
jgi:tetratricopeptide (TPR) repeat protein